MKKNRSIIDAGLHVMTANARTFGSRSFMIRSVTAIIMILMSISCPASAQVNGDGAKYAIISLTVPGHDIFVYAINEQGQIAAEDGNTDVAYIWSEGRVKILYGLVRGYGTPVHSINSAGTVVGTSRSALLNDAVATIWYAGNPPIEIGTLEGGSSSYAYGVNDRNHVVGYSFMNGLTTIHGFVWRDGVMNDLGALGSDISFAYGINNLDEVVGESGTADHLGHAVLWENDQMMDLGTLPGGGYESEAWAINDLGQVVGNAEDAQRNNVAFLWQDGVMQSIHDYHYGSWSLAFGINNSSQVVGTIPGDGRSLQHSDAFIWDPVNGMHNIEEYLPTDTHWDLQFAWDINDAGQIAGYGQRYGTLRTTGYMITPVTPTLHMDDPSSTQAGTDVTFTIHNADPGKTIHFIYGRVGGGYLIPGCNSQTGAVLQMDDPTVIGTAAADANGDASITAFVPLAARNAGDILLQAVEQSQCKITQLVVVRFQ